MDDSLEDILIRHSALLQRLVPQLSADVIKNIDKNNPELMGEILMWLDKNDEYRLTKQQQQQLEVLRNKVNRIRGNSIVGAGSEYEKQMVELGLREQAFLANGMETIGTSAVAVSSTKAMTKMVERLPITGQTIQQMYKSLSVNDTERIMRTVSQGLQNGLTKQQIQNAIFGTKKLNYTDGVLDITRRSVNDKRNNSGITRTTINAIQNESLSMLYQANSDIIPREMITAVLDGRTTFYCASVDGDVYPVGVGPRPPFHYNCRTIRVPEIDGINIRSTRPYVMDTRTRSEREKDFLAVKRDTNEPIKVQRAKWAKSRVGLIEDDVKYTGWFDNATVGFQKEYLGASRYKLYKDGGLKIADFTDTMANNYNLDQLYDKHKDAFKRAGIKPK